MKAQVLLFSALAAALPQLRPRLDQGTCETVLNLCCFDGSQPGFCDAAGIISLASGNVITCQNQDYSLCSSLTTIECSIAENDG